MTTLDPFITIEALSSALGRGELSSLELTDALLSRIASLDPALHCFTEVHAEAAREAARAADARRADGEAGLLLGVPLAVKDIFDMAGRETHAGSKALDDRRPTSSAAVVARLEALGMVILGRTHMVEFAYGGWGTNPVMGAPRNPWDRVAHRVAGGSSSGSGVAIAAGLTTAALGTDTGGSIRTPAAWCGVVGMKTSLGLISRAGVVPLAPTHDTVGPMTRSAFDAAVLIDAMSGPDPDDESTTVAPFVPALKGIEEPIRGLRIGILIDRDLQDVDASILGAYREMVGELTALGARCTEIRLPLSMEQYVASGGDIMSVEGYSHLGGYVERHKALVDPVIAARLLRGKSISGPDYYNVLLTRRAAQRAFQQAMQDFDAFIMPGSQMLPIPLVDVDENRPPNLFGRIVNYLDLAALAVPIGLSPDMLPIGLQIVVRKFDDALALRIGRALEKQRGGLFMRPPGF